MKRRGFIGLVLGALGLSLLPKKTETEYMIEIDPAHSGFTTCQTWTCLAQDYLSLEDRYVLRSDQLDALYGDQQRMGMP